MKTFDVTIDHILDHFVVSKLRLYVSFLIPLYVNLIRASKKVLYQLVYIGKKFVFLKEPLYFYKPVGTKNVKKWFVYYVISRFCNSL